MVSAEAQRTLVTHIFVEDCEYMRSDSVFGVKESLITQVEVQPAGPSTPVSPDIGDVDWVRVRFNIVLAPAIDIGDDDVAIVAVSPGSCQIGPTS